MALSQAQLNSLQQSFAQPSYQTGGQQVYTGYSPDTGAHGATSAAGNALSSVDWAGVVNQLGAAASQYAGATWSPAARTNAEPGQVDIADPSSPQYKSSQLTYKKPIYG